MSVDWNGAVPIVKVVAASDFRWRTLTPTGGAGGSALLDFTPFAFRARANAKTLIADRFRGYQLWASDETLGRYGMNVNCDTTKSLVCNRPEGCPTGDGSGCPYGLSCNVFLRNTGDPGEAAPGTGSGFVWWPVTRFNFGARNIVRSRTRFLPSGYAEARLFPFRWNSPTGRRYLFSSTNDAHVCDEFLFSAFYKMYVVRQMAQEDEPLEKDPSVQFLEQFLPPLGRALFPAP